MYERQLKDGRHTVMPQVRRWSDIAWVEWKYQVSRHRGTRVSDISYILVWGVQNTQTKVINQRINWNVQHGGRANQIAFPKWGDRNTVYIPASSEAGKALIGSPIGRGPSWFLIVSLLIPNLRIFHKTKHYRLIYDASSEPQG